MKEHGVGCQQARRRQRYADDVLFTVSGTRPPLSNATRDDSPLSTGGLVAQSVLYIDNVESVAKWCRTSPSGWKSLETELHNDGSARSAALVDGAIREKMLHDYDMPNHPLLKPRWKSEYARVAALGVRQNFLLRLINLARLATPPGYSALHFSTGAVDLGSLRCLSLPSFRHWIGHSIKLRVPPLLLVDSSSDKVLSNANAVKSIMRATIAVRLTMVDRVSSG
jgi:hypothetical protein